MLFPHSDSCLQRICRKPVGIALIAAYVLSQPLQLFASSRGPAESTVSMRKVQQHNNIQKALPKQFANSARNKNKRKNKKNKNSCEHFHKISKEELAIATAACAPAVVLAASDVIATSTAVGAITLAGATCLLYKKCTAKQDLKKTTGNNPAARVSSSSITTEQPVAIKSAPNGHRADPKNNSETINSTTDKASIKPASHSTASNAKTLQEIHNPEQLQDLIQKWVVADYTVDKMVETLKQNYTGALITPRNVHEIYSKLMPPKPRNSAQTPHRGQAAPPRVAAATSSPPPTVVFNGQQYHLASPDYLYQGNRLSVYTAIDVTLLSTLNGTLKNAFITAAQQFAVKKTSQSGIKLVQNNVTRRQTDFVVKVTRKSSSVTKGADSFNSERSILAQHTVNGTSNIQHDANSNRLYILFSSFATRNHDGTVKDISKNY